MKREHEPSAEFVERLEWQVRTALQRQSRFSQPVRHGNGGTMKLATVILVSALLGAGGMVMKEEVQESRVQEVLLAQVEMELELADIQVEMIQSELDEMRRQVATGAMEEDDLLSAEASLREAMAYRDRLQLNWEEIRVTGREPKDAVSAPLVEERDYVTERLELEMMVADEHLRIAGRELARMRDLAESGVVSSEQSKYAVAAVQRVQFRQEALQQRRQLRRRFLADEVTASDADLEAQVIDATSDLRAQDQRLELVMGGLQDMERRAEEGLIPQSDLRAARLEVRRMELARRLAELRLQQIREGGGEGR